VRAWLAQLVEHETFNLRVMGSSPMLGVILVPRLAEISYNPYRTHTVCTVQNECSKANM
jgi:hypothetical protein